MTEKPLWFKYENAMDCTVRETGRARKLGVEASLYLIKAATL